MPTIRRKKRLDVSGADRCCLFIRGSGRGLMSESGISRQIDYRPDIDGLRAVAVVAVLLFHAGLTSVSGGFAGVDVFFVISGYLITVVLMRDHISGGISIGRFYERRVRRIIPALLLLFVTTLATGYILLPPIELVELGKETIASIFFVSNIKFWKGADYWFSGLRPLLHTWSLSIEEQFYVFFPFLVAYLVRQGPRASRIALFFIWAASFAFSIVATYRWSSAAFFLLPSRIWELTTGAILALDYLPLPRRSYIREGASILGLVLIIAPFLAFTDQTPFPGFAALAPCLGTGLVLHAGRQGRTTVSALLGHTFMVNVGLISYSLYLFHYPIIIFAKEIAGEEQLSPIWIAGAVTTSLLLAVLSWRFVEQPVRKSRTVSRSGLFLSSALISALVATGAAGVISKNGFPNRFSRSQQLTLEATSDLDPRFQKCLAISTGAIFGSANCSIGSKSVAQSSFAVLGDSHAAAISSAIEPLAVQMGLRGNIFGFAACPPLLGLPMTHLAKQARSDCLVRVSEELKEIARHSEIKVVIIIAYWPAYYRSYGVEAENLISSSLIQSIDALQGKKIVLLYDLPTAPTPLPRRLVLADRLHQPPPTLDLTMPSAFEADVPALTRRGVKLISLATPLCPKKRNCPAVSGGWPILVDTNHLSRTVARRTIAPYLARRQIFGGSAAGLKR